MDRGKTIQTIAAITMLMLVFTGQASGSFKDCFGKCIRDCFVAGVFPPLCAPICLPKCIKAESINERNQCTLDCAVDQCSRFNHDVNKVANCVSKCEIGKCNHGVAYPPNSTPSKGPSIGAPSP